MIPCTPRTPNYEQDRTVPSRPSQYSNGVLWFPPGIDSHGHCGHLLLESPTQPQLLRAAATVWPSSGREHRPFNNTECAKSASRDKQARTSDRKHSVLARLPCAILGIADPQHRRRLSGGGRKSKRHWPTPASLPPKQSFLSHLPHRVTHLPDSFK